jgi:hypothetical protein
MEVLKIIEEVEVLYNGMLRKPDSDRNAFSSSYRISYRISFTDV